LNIIESECRFFEKILDEIKPHFLLISATDWHHMELLSALCKSQGIKVIMLQLAKFGFRSELDDEIGKTKKLPKSQKEISHRTIEEMQNLLKKDSRDTQMKVTKKELDVNWGKILKAGIDIMKTSGNNEYLQHYTNYGKTKKNVILKGIIQKLKGLYRQQYLNKNSIRKLNYNKPFIYYPIHFEPERVLLVDSPYFTNQLEVIKNIARSLPVGYQLYVKDHPVMNIRGWRRTSFYKQILEMPNVKLIHPSVSGEEIIKKSSMVITITGTSGIEALFHQKPTIAFTNFWGSSKLKSVPIVEKLEELPMLIKNTLDTQIDNNELNEYLDWRNISVFLFPEKNRRSKPTKHRIKSSSFKNF